MSGATSEEVGWVSSALSYARRGLRVIPLHEVRPDGSCSCSKGRECKKNAGKHPVMTDWVKEATTSKAKIRGWAERWPHANLGIALGVVGEFHVFVLDVDPRNGGDRTLADLLERHGDVPRGPEVATGGGGRHLYLKVPATVPIRCGKLGPGLDVKHEGGQVVAPPSRHQSGRSYTWKVDLDVPIPEAPGWLVALLAGSAPPPGPDGRPASAGSTKDGAPRDGAFHEGGRNEGLARLAGRLRHIGCTTSEIAAALLAVNRERCVPPLPDDEVRGIAGSIGRYPAGTEVELSRLSEVEAKRVSWLRHPMWAMGKLSIVAGDPGLGKSTLVLDAVARVTTGRTWPEGGGGGSPRPALLLSAEDDAADTILPRVIAMGGDPHLVTILSAVREKGRRRGLKLSVDAELLADAIRRVNPALTVVDPLTAYLGGIDSHVDADVRAALHPLKDVAEQLGAAVVAVMHMNKKEQGSPLYRVGGSIGFVAAARSVAYVIAHPRQKGQRLFLHVKTNNGPPADPMAFEVVDQDGVGALRWCEDPPSEQDLRAVLGGGQRPRGAPAADAAVAFLERFLADGPRSANEVYAAAQAEGISRHAVHTAKNVLGIKPGRQGGAAGAGHWCWHLPGSDS